MLFASCQDEKISGPDPARGSRRADIRRQVGCRAPAARCTDQAPQGNPPPIGRLIAESYASSASCLFIRSKPTIQRPDKIDRASHFRTDSIAGVDRRLEKYTTRPSARGVAINFAK